MRVLLHILAWLPLPVLHALGWLAGSLLWLVPNSRKRTALINVARCFPELPAGAQRRLVRRGLVNEGKSAFEMPSFWVGPAKRLLASVREERGGNVVEEALAPGKGLILLTPHLGSWEPPALKFSVNHVASGLYKPQPGVFDELALKGRQRFGARMLATEVGIARKMVEVLNRGETVYFLPDQDPPEGAGVFVPYFGIQAHTPTLVANLVRKSQARVVIYWGERLPWGRGFVAHWMHAPEAIYSKDVRTSVAALNAALEQCVRECPEQYWWGYKRFRRRPPGEPKFYG